jgi:hypothetical protein
MKGRELRYRQQNRTYLNKSGLFGLVSIFVCFMTLSHGPVSAEAGPIGKGAHFPNVLFKNVLSNEEESYLGVSGKTRVSFKDFAGTVFITEVFSTFCMTCPENVPVLNGVYSAIQNDPELRGKIKIVAFAAGDNVSDVGGFRKKYHVLYPVFADPGFTAHSALGGPRVPYTLIVKRNAKADMIVYARQGVLGSSEEVMRIVRGILSE